MASVTGKTSAAIDALFAAVIQSLSLDDVGQLTYTKKDGTVINAGTVASSVVNLVINSSGHLILTNRQGTITDLGKVTSSALTAYPVGALFFSTVTTDPATLLGGGTWERYGQGRTFVSVDTTDADFDAIGDTGGEKVHTLTVNEMPAHTHKEFPLNFQGSAGPYTGAFVATSQANQGKTSDTTSTGGGQPHNNMPPYIAVYVWRRTA